MREHPILFSTEMVLANKAGRKTKTRRIFKDHPQLASDISKVDLKQWFVDHYDYIMSFCPYGKPGDILWVREGFSPKYVKGCLQEFKLRYPTNHPWLYKADTPDRKSGYAAHPWKPSIHMPKEAARIWLKVTNVRVERLQDITESDAIAEGVRKSEGKGYYLDYLAEHSKVTQFIYKAGFTAKQSFRTLWELIHGPTSWRNNPWVWVVEYTLLSTTGRENIPAYILQQMDGKEVPA
jgi:hypothetical protein